MKLTVKQIAEAIGSNIPADGNAAVSSVSTDSRTIKQSGCFFAVKGPNFDGHNFVAQALKSGAACAVVQQKILQQDLPGTILTVSSTIDALGRLANYHRKNAGYKVIAITGSAGKTTTRSMTYHVLNRFYRCHQAQKSFNNNIGLPLTLLDAPDDTQIVIAELGSNAPGEIAALAKIAVPDVAAITNVYPVHLAGFGDIENIAAEKASIHQELLQNGDLIINGDCDVLRIYCRNNSIKAVTFGFSPGCDIRGSDINLDAAGSSFKIDGQTVRLGVLGRANIENALACFAICSRFGVKTADFAKAIETYLPVSMRLEQIRFGNITVLNDCYNANPMSMKNAIETLILLAEKNHKRPVLICGTMAELGQNAAEIHRQIGEFAIQKGVKLLVAAGDFAGEYAAGAGDSAKYFANKKELCDNLQNFIKADDIILVKASRCAGFEEVVEKIRADFSLHR